jgi:hypothetical protein
LADVSYLRKTQSRTSIGWEEVGSAGETTYGISDGVSGFDPGGGRLIKVGCDEDDACAIVYGVSKDGGEEWLGLKIRDD